MLPSWIKGLCGSLGGFGLAWTVVTIAPRVGSVWPLEWMEGASLQHALRLLEGKPLYGPPVAEFIPFVYPPLAYVPMALSAQLGGSTLVAARLPSLVAWLVTSWCIARVIRRETGELAFGVLGAGLFALGFGYNGAFADLARVDSVFIALLLLAAERASSGRKGQALAALALSVFAKQHGLVFLAVLSLVSIMRVVWPARGSADEPEAPAAEWLARWAPLRPVMRAWLLVAIGLSALQLASGGWFWRYAFTVPAGHGIEPVLLASYLYVDVALYLPVLSSVIVLGALRREPAQAEQTLRARRAPWVERWAPWLVAALIASALGRAHPGGDDNVRMPGYAFITLIAPLALSQLWAAVRTARARVAYAAALCLQVAMLTQPPALHWPDAQKSGFEPLRAALDRCADTPRPTPGTARTVARSVALDHALLTGTPFMHTMALSDLRTSDDRALAARATSALIRALEAIDRPRSLAVSVVFPELGTVLDRHYEFCTTQRIRLPTGYQPTPVQVYSARRRASLVGASGQ